MRAPSGFTAVQHGRTRMLVRCSARAWIAPVLGAAPDNWSGYDTRPLSRGRGGAVVVEVAPAGHAVVIRPGRRGGVPGRVLHDIYFGLRPRPFRELCVIDTLRRRGAPVVEVYGAAVRWLLPGCYRGWLATRYVRGARTLWEWANEARPAPEREATWSRVGAAIRRLHDCGARHPDLNLNNILICSGAPAAEPPDVVFVDFDRARVCAPSRRATAADLARLRRSARTLDPQATYVTLADVKTLEAGYRAAAADRFSLRPGEDQGERVQ